MKILITFFVLFFSSSVFADELATWGMTGSNCNDFFRYVDEDQGDLYALIAIQSFLTGFNTALAVEGKFDSVRVINHDTYEYIIDYIKNSCGKSDLKDSIYLILWQYFETLPIAE